MILKNINKSYQNKKILNDVSLEIPDKGIFGVFGPSGGGKTTLLRIICGLEKPDSGEIIGSKKFSVVFQEDRLMPEMTALENVAAVSDEKTALGWLEKVGLSESVHKKPAELSGGMSRRVAIARALAFDADALILDEPFKGLEEELKEKTAGLISEYAQKRAVILVTHDERLKKLAADFIEITLY
ncbi:MAG: ATP-binding cassette domain-containing protein [Clostridia bacterium]|nr:ATP-binding cassette domain-containing protein [Clostridia bacterium]